MNRFRNGLLLGCAIMSDPVSPGAGSAEGAGAPAAAEQTQQSSSGGWGATALSVIQKILTVAETVASVLPPTSSVVSAIQLATQIGNGLANDIPSVVSAWGEIQQTAQGGQPATAEQWAAWNAAADTAHAQFVADEAAAEKAAGG